MSGVMAVVIPFLTGVIGLLAGYFLNIRRERWNLKRDLYTRLLENLGEMVFVLGELFELTNSEDEEEEKEGPLRTRSEKALGEIRRAHHVAVLMLRRDATEALENLYKEMGRAGRAKTYEDFLIEKRNAAGKAYDFILEAARSDLRL